VSENVPQPVSQSSPTGWARVARRIRVPLGFIAAALYIWLARPSWVSIAAGIFPILCGLSLRGFASGHVQKNRELTVSGPYAYTRNPLYLGSLLMAAGFAIAARSLWFLILMLLLFFLIYIPVIAGEERYLRTAFPEYDDYARRVPRFLPRLTPYSAVKGQYSAALYWKHREYRASLGCTALLAILVAKVLLSS
jgi:protein-S-isoprenylcysteine O-methyltransferase Ste14